MNVGQFLKKVAAVSVLVCAASAVAHPIQFLKKVAAVLVLVCA